MAARRTYEMMISTSKEAIEVLGGTHAVARWLGTSPDNVLMMRHRGYVARGYHLHFYVTLLHRGHKVAPSLFGLTTFDALIMPLPKGAPKKTKVCRQSAAA